MGLVSIDIWPCVIAMAVLNRIMRVKYIMLVGENLAERLLNEQINFTINSGAYL